jgi:hypothetical protein
MDNSNWTLKIDPYKDGQPMRHFKNTNCEAGLNLKNPDPDASKGFIDFVTKMSAKVSSP